MYYQDQHHKKHKHHRRDSSSSSSSSSSSDEEKKRLKKERKAQKKLMKQMKKQGVAMPAGGYPVVGYPTQPGYPAPVGGYPTGSVPPPGNPYSMAGGAPGGYPGTYAPPPQPGFPGQPPPAGGAPAFTAPGAMGPGQQPYPGGQAPYPGQPAYPAGQQAYPGQPMFPPGPAYPQSHSPQPGGAPYQPAGYSTGPAYSTQPGTMPGYAAQPGGSVYPAGGAAVPGFTAPPVGYSTAPGSHAPPTGGMYPDVSSGQPAGGYSVQQAGQDLSKLNLQGTAEAMYGTIVSPHPFSAENDAQVLRGAMKGAGTDERAIIDVLSHRGNKQRQEIKLMFKTMYGKDLIRDIESELSGDVKETVMALFTPTTYYDAWSLHRAMEGAGTKEGILIEILCTRTNSQIKEIVKCYKESFQRDLEQDIIRDTSGHFKRLLVSCCQGNRAELTQEQLARVLREGPSCVVDANLARNEAQELYQAGERKFGTDESTFLKIMAIRHYYQLRATFTEYERIAGKDIVRSIEREMSGDLESGFKALAQSVRNRPEYFTDKLRKAMKGLGTNDSALIRIIVSRSEIDLGNIKQIYQQKYGKTLHHAVEKETSGDYRRLLLAVIGN